MKLTLQQIETMRGALEVARDVYERDAKEVAGLIGHQRLAANLLGELICQITLRTN